MQFSEHWLRTMVNPELTSDALSHLLTMAGLEVEEVEPVAPPFTQVVVAQVMSMERHPNADRLNVCQVDAGTGALLTIVCGAPNVRPGMKVPCALAGAKLPPGEDGKPFEIRVSKLRGVESQGMLCSARELRLSDENAGLLELGDAARRKGGMGRTTGGGCERRGRGRAGAGAGARVRARPAQGEPWVWRWR
jgi:phenylalanyl-tRNA synthetase beta chain